MATMSTERAKVRSRIGVVVRTDPNSPELVDLRREFAALKILDFVHEVLAGAPPLNQRQRDRITAALNSPPAA